MTRNDEEPDARAPAHSAVTRMPRPIREQSETPVLSAASALALEHIGEGVLVADMRLRGQPIVQVNPAFEAITGYAAAEATGMNCLFLVGSDRMQPEIPEVQAAFTQGRACSVTLRSYRRDGTMFRSALRLVPLRDPAGEVTHYVGTVRDLTHLPGIDRLTGLLDRFGLIDRLAALDAEESAAVLLVKLDIVRFHDVNNGFGHEAGNALLLAIAKRLATLPAVARSRVGPSGFALAFEIDELMRAASLLDDVVDVMKPPFLLAGEPLAVPVAIGFSIGSAASDPLQLLRQAESAAQRSGSTPGHPPQPFSICDDRDARTRIRLSNELRTAIANQEFVFHYQPQIDLASGNLVGAEALLRWDHGVFGLQSAERFIGVAEESGAILDIGAWGLRTLAAHAARVNRSRDTPLRFAINISVLDVTQRDMAALLEQVLGETGCKAEWLTLELTETQMVSEWDTMCRALGKLRQLGVGLSVDDFGTGYSNLRYLQRFPLSEIKIDRSFVRGVADSPVNRVLVESVVRLGRAMGLCVVAEGIETEADRAAMQALGCSVGQGHLFAAPMDRLQFENLLQQTTHDGAGGRRPVPG